VSTAQAALPPCRKGRKEEKQGIWNTTALQKKEKTSFKRPAPNNRSEALAEFVAYQCNQGVSGKTQKPNESQALNDFLTYFSINLSHTIFGTYTKRICLKFKCKRVSCIFIC
jgi:hypothetical protein